MNAYELSDEMNKPVENTDKEIWREIEGEYYCSKIFVTEKGCIGIDVGGHIYVKTVDEWHKQADRIAELEKKLQESALDYISVCSQADEHYARLQELEKQLEEHKK